MKYGTSEGEVNKRAWSVFKLSIRRAGRNYPRWARTSKMRRHFLRLYKKAQRKNGFRWAYGKDGEVYHVDHIIPLHGTNVSGLHVPWNLKVIRRDENLAKGTKIVEEWIPKAEV